MKVGFQGSRFGCSTPAGQVVNTAISAHRIGTLFYSSAIVFLSFFLKRAPCQGLHQLSFIDVLLKEKDSTDLFKKKKKKK